MKKKSYIGLTLAFLFLAGGAIAMQSQNSCDELSSLMMENIEALSDKESAGGGTCRWERVHDKYGCVCHICSENGNGASCYPCGTETQD